MTRISVKGLLILIRLGWKDWSRMTGQWTQRYTNTGWVTVPIIIQGLLAESWEFTDQRTYVAHLRKGIHWQDIPPANGREFVADDVVFHYNRLYGLGGGFNKPSPFHTSVIRFQDLISVTATDKYTVVFKWRTPNPDFIMETLHSVGGAQCLENPDAVKKWGDVSDWHHAIGTGPFILKDFVSNRLAALVKNPNYWGYDERYPQNKLPYVDSVKYLIIPDNPTAMELMRIGVIDVMDGISFKQAQAMQKTNPDIFQITLQSAAANSIDPRNDKPPFNDIRVRKAMQMAIDLPTICKSYYGGTVDPYPCTLTSRDMKGWGFPYDEWPQDLKDEYTYNPIRAKKLLSDAGYPDGFRTNIIVDSAGDVDLIKIVKSYFADIDIEMDIQVKETAEWIDFVQIGHKHDQLVHHPVGPLGKSSPPLRDLTRFQTGSSVNCQMVSDPVYDAFNVKAMTATNLDDVKQILKEANEYIARQHFSISLLQQKEYALCQPWLKGYSGQFSSIFGPAAGPSMLNFYLARFWVDQKLKESKLR